MRLVVASGNSHKLQEIKRILSLPGLELLSRDDFSSWPEWEETGADYYENAFIKARAIFSSFGLPALADDSGLEVDYLHGRPGLFSARYSGREGDYRANNAKLLSELSGVPLEQRKARFVCVALCFIDEESVIEARGTCEGHIAQSYSGVEGFGYDPIFIPRGHDRSMAELSATGKDAISHRGVAFRDLGVKMREYVNDHAD